jgi:hypothetical protein
VLALAAREHDDLIAKAEQAAFELPRSLRETVRYGLRHIVDLPAGLAYASETLPKRLKYNRSAREET